ncbi:hypothetical protein A3A54_00515 [Candidatus Curtissbacteria bacterium RIFCSPLOWO2_01_FULL_39_62]|uniref:Ribbon-helix-helix protein CopG domain-containing protein n=3 Tax=Microgenomates group TaxID=1794810 RepID=A0A1F5G6P4_9BACT|nr:MAG: hypothetical protein UT61_C0049G0005 [Candidatus Woesebacteria bacterium GW2011_GWA1_39_8]OGD87546.1 MAG: hypothetical protein A3D04_04665 [Candidatus Curtissbacteria bacterium RIFCSPHIGHO2_02_FULL_40_16b]OGE00914.1 MAG: hypothetical protein A3J17_03245 [Candidatus Curtissbacteria bacterium RIFCSPLOWO2_02_FULL_40_11]OGE02748.1 MAG: hypothetical protein A3A54_00515 [Candidatus Curtissbacteria bacterium RIFCSPLOWO2_01_FULL_39_62]OGE12085.1 MAG: hypothetical protein A3G14_00745 [Candidatus
MNYARTTLTLDPDILKEAKKLAADEKKPLKGVIEAALKNYLEQKVKTKKLTLADFPAFNLGRVNEKLINRENLYGDYLDRKFPPISKK